MEYQPCCWRMPSAEDGGPAEGTGTSRYTAGEGRGGVGRRREISAAVMARPGQRGIAENR